MTAGRTRLEMQCLASGCGRPPRTPWACLTRIICEGQDGPRKISGLRGNRLDGGSVFSRSLDKHLREPKCLYGRALPKNDVPLSTTSVGHRDHAKCARKFIRTLHGTLHAKPVHGADEGLRTSGRDKCCEVLIRAETIATSAYGVEETGVEAFQQPPVPSWRSAREHRCSRWGCRRRAPLRTPHPRAS